MRLGSSFGTFGLGYGTPVISEVRAHKVTSEPDQVKNNQDQDPSLSYSLTNIREINLRRQILAFSRLVNHSMLFLPDLDESKLFEHLVQVSMLGSGSGSDSAKIDAWKPQSFTLDRKSKHCLSLVLHDEYHRYTVGNFRSIRWAKVQAKRRLNRFIYMLHTDSYCLTFASTWT